MQNDRYRKRMFKEEEHENDIENPGDPAVSMHGHYVDADPGVGVGRSLGPAGSTEITEIDIENIDTGLKYNETVPFSGSIKQSVLATMLMRYSN